MQWILHLFNDWPKARVIFLVVCHFCQPEDSTFYHAQELSWNKGCDSWMQKKLTQNTIEIPPYLLHLIDYRSLSDTCEAFNDHYLWYIWILLELKCWNFTTNFQVEGNHESVLKNFEINLMLAQFEGKVYLALINYRLLVNCLKATFTKLRLEVRSPKS
jgi:hypothetical protein